ncbi:MAG TPA: choice-of-anchor tandem repeat GloVer-containing protein [Steroidobacteraceae bacterium]|nr:choice-of-anchor tandem repeat GloVer-containing protein [Steroidobacteraceae bacterium]
MNSTWKFTVVVCYLVFAISANADPAITYLHQFYNDNPFLGAGDALIIGPGGDIYGTTDNDVSPNNPTQNGTIFRIDLQTNTFTTIYNFSELGSYGTPYPNSIMLATNLGLSFTFGSPQLGLGLYSFNPDTGKRSAYYDLPTSNSLFPTDNPYTIIDGGDGKYYGTSYGATGNYGTIFSINIPCGDPSQCIGTTTILHSFSAIEGGHPMASMLHGSDGNFYGSTPTTLFRITPSGAFTTLHAFSEQTFPQLSFQDTDGNFYGFSAYNNTFTCPNQCGTIFKMTPSGSVTTLLTFPSVANGNPTGNFPTALIRGSDANYYGIGKLGNGLGSYIFELTPAGQFKNLVYINITDNGHTGLLEGPYGILYGISQAAVFKVTGLPLQDAVNEANAPIPPWSLFLLAGVLFFGVYRLQWLSPRKVIGCEHRDA